MPGARLCFHDDAEPIEIDTQGQIVTGHKFGKGLMSAIVISVGIAVIRDNNAPLERTRKTSLRADFIGRYKSRSTSANEIFASVE
jgi:hypothetical protein